MQASGECWCGNYYGKYGKYSNVATCGAPCADESATGVSQQYCGGGWANAVYKPVYQVEPDLVVVYLFCFCVLLVCEFVREFVCLRVCIF